MQKIISFFSNSYSEYKEYRDSFLRNRIKGMMILTGLITLYGLSAPLFIQSITAEFDVGSIHREFAILALASGLPFAGYLIVFFSKKMSRSLMGTLYELFTIAVFFSTSVIYLNNALRNSVAMGEYPDYTAFYIISLIILITFVMYPVHFIVCYGIASAYIVNVVDELNLASFKPKYNLILFCIATAVMYIIKYRSHIHLFQRSQQIIKIQKDRERFMINLTHEMRTPLNAILGKNQMILADTNEPETRQLSRQINGSGKLLLSLINDILDQSKLVVGKMTLVESDYKPVKMIHELGDIMRTMAEEQGLSYLEDISDSLPSILRGDEIRIKQIILNLLSNAIKYTHSGSVTLKIDFEEKEDNIGKLLVSVSDTGIGIKEEDLPKLTQTFVRIEEQRNQSIQGTGLGLSITSRLLEIMGGKLEIESTYGQGSTFSFAIDQKIVSTDEDTCSTEENSTPNAFPNANILIVDDSNINIMVLKGLLSNNSISADSANSGIECLSLVSKKKYDIIFLDHMMPELDGVETLKRLRNELSEQTAATKIVALTANYDSNAREVYESYGFDCYLAKPVEIPQLNIVLNLYLNQ